MGAAAAAAASAEPASDAVVTTTIRLRFDGRSTTYQRSLRSQRRNSLAAVTLTCPVSQKSDAKTQIVVTITELIRINYPVNLVN